MVGIILKRSLRSASLPVRNERQTRPKGVSASSALWSDARKYAMTFR